MRYSFTRRSRNSKTGPIPVTSTERASCPPSCPHKAADCYAEAGYYTRMHWDRVADRGIDIDALAARIAALPAGQLWRHDVAGDLPGDGETVDAYELGRIVAANRGRRGWTYTHKHRAGALKWIRHAIAWGFTVNLSADDAGHADRLAETGLPVCAIVPIDTPERTATPAGRPIVVCPAQTRDDVTCATCGLCQRADRRVIVGFRAHGARARATDAIARRVIPIARV
jgi:hypothetical protein